MYASNVKIVIFHLLEVASRLLPRSDARIAHESFPRVSEREKSLENKYVDAILSNYLTRFVRERHLINRQHTPTRPVCNTVCLFSLLFLLCFFFLLLLVASFERRFVRVRLCVCARIYECAS